MRLTDTAPTGARRDGKHISRMPLCHLPRLAVAALAAALLAPPELDAQTKPRAELVLLHGHVITVDKTDRIAQAVAIAGATIIAVGTDAAILKLADASTTRIDLKGRTVTPGLLDAHAHFSGGGSDRLFVVDVGYPAAKSVADIIALVGTQAKKQGGTAFIEGRGWDEGKLAEKRLVTAKDLDAVSPTNPVWLEQTTGHYGVANSVALTMAGITRDTKDPANGTIDRYPDGTPTGVLKESAQALVRRLIPPKSTAQVEQGMRELAQAFVAEGMTGLKDPGINGATWDSYRRVAAEGNLPVRVFALWRSGTNAAAARALIAERAGMTRPYESTGDDHVIAGGVKLYMDGSGGARTAWMHDDWNKNYTEIDVGNHGYPASNPDTIRALIRMYHDAGMHVSVHSIGDNAIDWTVDSYAQALQANPKRGLRHGIIHANVPSEHALDEMARMEKTFDAAYPEPSASFTWWLGDSYASNFGATRSLRLNPLASYLKRGIHWANGSDFSVTPFAARYGIWAAVARQTLLGDGTKDPFGRAEAVDVHVALKAVTIWAAHQMFLEKKIGSIEVGKYADLAVWDRDLYAVKTEQLRDMACELTVFNGKVVYERAGSK